MDQYGIAVEDSILSASNKTESEIILEKVVTDGDLSRLSPKDRTLYYHSVCKSIGVNPLTKPFDYITMKGKMSLYANKGCTDQIRRVQGISIEISSREKIDDIYIVTAKAIDSANRYDESTAAIELKGLTGEDLCNALMKCETKAKRRVTLSIVGLGMMDETEVQTIPEASKVEVNQSTGEIIDSPLKEVVDKNDAKDKLFENLGKIIGTIDLIIENLSPKGNIKKAAFEWFSMSNEEKRLAWTPKSQGGPFNSEQKKILSSASFRKIYEDQHKQHEIARTSGGMSKDLKGTNNVQSKSK